MKVSPLLWGYNLITMAKKKAEGTDLATEEKIKDAARNVFTKKGYAATRTRDIAEEAGINLALLNYYFRSKENLFELVMMEKIGNFFGTIGPILDDSSLELEKKVTAISERYIELLLENQDLPIFILSEIRTNPAQFVNKLPTRLLESNFIKQLKERRPDLHPAQFLMNILALTVFPFIMKPVLEQGGVLNEKSFVREMTLRKTMIPKWFKAMLKVT